MPEGIRDPAEPGMAAGVRGRAADRAEERAAGGVTGGIEELPFSQPPFSVNNGQSFGERGEFFR
ncbi:MAG: hypothetical protein ABIK43_05100 [candidate division WOR-3 bacterium]